MLYSIIHLKCDYLMDNYYTFSMENQLADFERRYNITQRWKPTDTDFVDASQAFLMEKKNQLYNSLWTVVAKRHYLLRMKARYAGMLVIPHTTSWVDS